MESLTSWGEGDARTFILLAYNATDLMSIGVARPENWFVRPEKVRDPVCKACPDNRETVKMPLGGVVDESVVRGEHLQPVKKTLRVVEVLEAFRLIDFSLGLKVVFAHAAGTGEQIVRDRDPLRE